MKHIPIFLVLSLPLMAQDAAQTSSRLQESIDRARLQQQVDARRNAAALPEGFKTEEDKSDEAAATAEEKQPVLPLKKLEFGPTRVLPASLLTELRAKYEGKALSIADIKGIAKAVNDYYREHGYITSRAYLPEQDVSGGTLHIALLEGTIGKVVTKGLTTTKPAYVQRAVGMREGDIFRVSSIEQDLAEFNAFTDLKSRLNISPGSADGTSDLELITQEKKRFGATLFTDNGGQHSTGYYRGGLFATARGLASTAYTRDILTAGYVGSEGSDTFSGAYTITENVLKTTWSLALDHSETDCITKELKDLDVEGKFTSLSLSGKRALYADTKRVFTNGLLFALKDNESSIESYKLNAYRTNTLAYTLDALCIFDHGYFYNAANIIRGWQLTENGNNFWRAVYRAEGNYAFNPFVGVYGRFHAQISNRRELQSSEQLQLGGVNTVRGYEEGMLNGEAGYALQTELRFNLKSLRKSPPAWLNTTEAFLFYDCGQLSHETDSATLTDANEQFLASAGGGLRIKLWNHLSASGTIAMPLKKSTYNIRDNKPHYLFAIGAEF